MVICFGEGWSVLTWSKNEICKTSKNFPVDKLSYCHDKVDSLIIVVFYLIGYGVFAKKTFSPGDFLLEYPSENISLDEAEEREKEYETMGEGSFIFFLEVKKKLRG